MKTPLEQSKQKQLRAQGILSSDEIAYMEGDIAIAENVLNGSKRRITSSVLTEGSDRKILFG